MTEKKVLLLDRKSPPLQTKGRGTLKYFLLWRKSKASEAGAEAEGIGEVAAGDEEGDGAAREGLFEEGGSGGGAGGFGDDVGVVVQKADGIEHFVVGDEDDVVDEFADGVDVFGFGGAGGEAVGDGVAGVGGDGAVFFPGQIIGWGAFGLDADDLHARVGLFDCGGEAADERGISHGDVDGGDLGELREDFEADGGGAGGEFGVGGVVEEIDAGAAGIFIGCEKGVGEIGAAGFDDLRAEIGNALALDGIGIGGKKNGGADAEGFGGEGDGGSVIAGAGCDDFLDGAMAERGGEGVEGAARFEGVGGENGFEFEVDFDVAAGERRAGDEGSDGEIDGEELLGGLDGGEGRRDGHGSLVKDRWDWLRS